MPDGLFEIWQANSHGRYNHPDDRRNLPLDAGFEGYGRASTFTDGCARFSTVKPGRVPWPAGGMQAPHINVSIFARGLLNRVATRLYFDGDPANAEDPVLKMIDPARRADAAGEEGRQGRLAPADPSRRPERNRLLRRLSRWPVALVNALGSAAATAEAFSDTATLRHMLRFEAALAKAAADAGLIPSEARGDHRRGLRCRALRSRRRWPRRRAAPRRSPCRWSRR